MSKSLCQSFAPLAPAQAKILILGSMPGLRSLQEQEYYAHPQNIFWDIMAKIFSAHRDLSYERRLKILASSRVALWDVAWQCEREGSLDTKINTASVVPNDFENLFSKCPKIRQVFFNGHKAESLYRSLVYKKLPARLQQIPATRLPSTSPAHASLTGPEKMQIWRKNILAHFSKE